jgi:hypothetical protein
VTVITPGAGFSITSTTVVSTVGAAARFRRTFLLAAFFTAARLGVALATLRLVAFPRPDLDVLRVLRFVAALFLPCTFDRFFRLAMIDPFSD